MPAEQFLLISSWADLDPVRFELQLGGQRRALSDFDVRARTKPGWPVEKKSGPINLVHLIHGPTGKTVGGMCVQFRVPEFPLPTEQNLADSDLTAEIASHQSDLPSEFCGTWIAREFRKKGLLPFLFSGAVAAAYLAGSRRVFSSAHEKAAALYAAYGVEIDGSRGYAWPDRRYRTLVARINLSRFILRESPTAKLAREIMISFAERRRHEILLEAGWAAASAGQVLA